MRFSRVLYSSMLGIASLIVSVSSSAAGAPRKPIRVDSSQQETVTFSRLVVRIKGSHDVGLAPEAYRILFLEKMRKLGYPALGAESLVFDQDKSEKARFAVGGTIQELNCVRQSGSNRQCAMGIQWEVLDRKDNQVVYRLLSRYSASGSTPEQLGETLALGAFYSLLARPTFGEAMKSSAQPAPQQTTYASAKFKTCPNQRLDMPGRAEDALKATVLIEAGQSLGSGAVISPDGLVLTAAHVVEGASVITVQFRAGQQAEAKLIRINSHNDVALLKTETTESIPCVSMRSQPMRVGEEIFAIGSPLSKQLSFTLTRGIVSATREIDGVSLIQTDASVNPGNSGGPLLDKNGQWTALVSWKLVGRGVQGIAFGVPTRSTLQALGLESGEQTERVLTQGMTTDSRQEREVVIDDPDPVIQLSSGYGSMDSPSESMTPTESLPEQPLPKKARTDPATTFGGVALVISGVALGAYALKVDSKDVDTTYKVAMLSLSGIAIGGGIALLSSEPDKKKPQSNNSTSLRTVSPTLDASIGLGTASVFGTF